MTKPPPLALPTKAVRTLEGHTASVTVAKFNRKGEHCVSGGYDRTLRLWNPFNGKLIKTYRGHGYQVTDLDISYDNSRIASCGGDRQPFLWDVTTGRVIRKFKGHDHQLNSIMYNNECTILVTGSYDKTVKVWDVKARTFDPVQTMDDARDSVTSVFISSYEIITGSVDGCVRTYDIRAGELRTDHIGQPVTCVSLSHDENILLVSSLDGVIRLLDKDDGSLYQEYKGHKNKEFKILSTFSNDDAFVVSGSEDGDIWFWGLEEGTVLHVAKGHKGMTCGLSYHPEEPYLLSSSADNTIKLWTSSLLAPNFEQSKQIPDTIA
jgi:mitogen-activated protein kinase organizer 1